MAKDYKIILVSKEQFDTELKRYQNEGWDFFSQSPNDNETIKIMFTRDRSCCIIM